MKKKVVIFIVLLAVVIWAVDSFSASPHTASGYTDNQSGPDFSDKEFALKYYPVEAHFEGAKLCVAGTFINGSGVNDILRINEAEIVICDKNGNELGRSAVNDRFAQNCIIPPNGGLDYNITCDLSGSSTINSVWDIRYGVEGSYQYDTCQGPDCPYHTITPHPTPIDRDDDTPPAQMECYWCHGSGICKECGGTGKNDASGVLSSMGCTLCGKTGKCSKCSGTGYILIY